MLLLDGNDVDNVADNDSDDDNVDIAVVSPFEKFRTTHIVFEWIEFTPCVRLILLPFVFLLLSKVFLGNC